MVPEPAIKNMEELIAPISEDQPTGVDIREDRALDSLYQKIKDARNTARGLERKYSADGDNPLDYWKIVLEIAPEILKTQSKDLDIACWYVEALVRLEGFRGLHDGIELIAQLVENHWENMFPMPDEDGMETRVLQLAGLNGQGADGVLVAPIRRAPFTDSEDQVSFWQYQLALDANNIADDSEKKKKLESLEFNLEDIEKAVASSSNDFYTSQRDDLEEAIARFKETGRKLDELCGSESPSTSNIVNAMQQCLGAIRHLGDKNNKFPIDEVAETDENAEAAEGAEPGTAPAATAAASGPIANREQAFKQLRLISEFFLKTEPHSPISYALDKTISWGDMSLTELINELIPDGGSRQHYGLLTGVKNSDE